MIELPRPLRLFLDLDGVFKTGRSITASMRFDPVLSKMVNDLCRLPGTLVVISATCRLDFKIKEDAELFWCDLGMPDLKLHDDWWTTRGSDARPLEIQEWLKRNHDKEPKVEYLFLDDEMPSYHEGMEDRWMEICKQGWLLVSGHYNGANYRQLRTLRDIFDDHKKVYEEAAIENTASESAGSITSREVAESAQGGRSPSGRAKQLKEEPARKLDSLSADAQLGFKGILTQPDKFISVRAHVNACREEGCFICTSLIPTDFDVPGIKSQQIPQRTDNTVAHANAEEATKGYAGS